MSLNRFYILFKKICSRFCWVSCQLQDRRNHDAYVVGKWDLSEAMRRLLSLSILCFSVGCYHIHTNGDCTVPGASLQRLRQKGRRGAQQALFRLYSDSRCFQRCYWATTPSEERQTTVHVLLRWRSKCVISAGTKAGPLPPQCLWKTESLVLTRRHLLTLPKPWCRVGRGQCWALLCRTASSASRSLWLLFFDAESHSGHTPKPFSAFTHPAGNGSMVTVKTLPVHLNLCVHLMYLP